MNGTFLKQLFHLVGVLQLVSLGLGWSKKQKSLRISKLDGGVRSMAPVEGTSKNNMDLQCANPTYRRYPDAMPELN